MHILDLKQSATEHNHHLVSYASPRPTSLCSVPWELKRIVDNLCAQCPSADVEPTPGNCVVDPHCGLLQLPSSLETPELPGDAEGVGRTSAHPTTSPLHKFNPQRPSPTILASSRQASHRCRCSDFGAKSMMFPSLSEHIRSIIFRRKTPASVRHFFPVVPSSREGTPSSVFIGRVNHPLGHFQPGGIPSLLVSLLEVSSANCTPKRNHITIPSVLS
ncbi:hypothetical protein GQ43DRAFT_47956 [Delitschia confertaspora ATCC 74209]|uniref:Uncharacterized protein n=1 Tax=Delitschia confertaspora ATCC 74209 TaxID=1513339 RepID=A0A9P4JL47_9PLEO|nr:hypothetical protein GQ43DRAFT_47956 [Delitschia confertaspora ATCC 74209]